MTGYTYTVFIILIPLVMFLVTGLLGMKWKPIVSGVLGTIGMGTSWVLSLITAASYFFGGHHAEGFQSIIPIETTWQKFTDTLVIKMGILLDPISVMMLVVITTISFMVHLYSIGYMHGEKGFQRFFAFLSLFTFSMLGLVIATNIFQMYIFWELVGVSSFLLIGFYYQKPSAVAASKKAFIVTRFADLGFLIGILILSFVTGTFDFAKLTEPGTTIFGSAAFDEFHGYFGHDLGYDTDFYWWVPVNRLCSRYTSGYPDAMEGPTPVSALIHAATMVVAGVFLVARMFPVIHFQAPAAQEIIGYVGGFTSLFAAVIAITQYDIKRVLAFLNFITVGLHDACPWGFRIRRRRRVWVTWLPCSTCLHTAMYKALLFLGAGSIIHSRSFKQHVRHGRLAQISANYSHYIPDCLFDHCRSTIPFQDFFSKDEILVAALHHNKLLFAVEFLVAGLTAFYMFRLYFCVFWGKRPPLSSYSHTRARW